MSTPIPLAVASDMSQSRAFSEQRLVNLFPETSQLGGKSPFILVGTPGLKPYTSVGTGPWRGGITMAGISYVVSGAALYRLRPDGTILNIGLVAGDGLVSMATAGTQIAISLSRDTGYIYDSSSGAFGEITDPDFFGASSVTALDGYFIWSSSDPYVTRFQCSALLDGTSYDALDFASAESTAYPLIRVFLVGTQLFMMKSDRIEVWYNAGNADFPFERLNSAIIPKGLAAKYSPALADNSVFWVGYDDAGGGSPAVYRASGYTPVLVSTHAVARALSTVRDLSLVVGISYVKDNHTFYGLILPDGNAWFYDIGLGMWHERATYGYSRWLGNGHIDAYGKTLIGSCMDGALYELDLDTHFDNTTIPIRWEATLPAFGTDPELKRCSRLRLDMQTGAGLSTGQGSDPIINLNVSDDRGESWSSDLPASMGPQGKYGRSVEWRQMGQFRSRVHRFWGSDPVKTVLLALYADIQK